jgi:predicted aldo/keto reductase-like oxidoreductase
LRARTEGRIRFIGLTGHHDPKILLEAMRRHSFDSVLCALNPADPRKRPFASTVVAEARRQGMGVVGMKVLGAGRLVIDAAATPAELIRYAASQVDTVIIGCSSVAEVSANLAAAHRFQAMPPAEMVALERRISPRASRYDYFKAD